MKYPLIGKAACRRRLFDSSAWSISRATSSATLLMKRRECEAAVAKPAKRECLHEFADQYRRNNSAVSMPAIARSSAGKHATHATIHHRAARGPSLRVARRIDTINTTRRFSAFWRCALKRRANIQPGREKGIKSTRIAVHHIYQSICPHGAVGQRIVAAVEYKDAHYAVIMPMPCGGGRRRYFQCFGVGGCKQHGPLSILICNGDYC